MTVNVTYDFSGQVADHRGGLGRGPGPGRVVRRGFCWAYAVAADRDEPGLAQTCACMGTRSWR